MSDKIKAVGSKAEVFHGSARHTSGNLHKKDLMRHKDRIISRKKHAAGKKAIKHLFALGYKPSKGTFKAMHKSMSHKKKKSRHTRKNGGALSVASAAPVTNNDVKSVGVPSGASGTGHSADTSSNVKSVGVPSGASGTGHSAGTK